MWTCPRCRHKFVHKNQSHSCGNYTVGDFLRGRPRKAVDLFHDFIRQYRRIGPFRLDPVKTRVALLTLIRFCAINRIGEDYIDVHFVLTEPHDTGGRFRRVENLGNRFYIHHLRIRQKADIDGEVLKCMRLAYRIGKRGHIAGIGKRTAG